MVGHFSYINYTGTSFLAGDQVYYQCQFRDKCFWNPDREEL